MHLLLIDDNRELIASLQQLLHEERYDVHISFTIAEAKQALSRQQYDLIVLDWILPDGSGVELLQKIRREGIDTPVLLFSSKDEVTDKVEALDQGADDYLQKPFSHIELLARIRALLRRESAQKRSRIELASVTIDLAQRSVTCEGKVCRLSATEFALLEFLALNAGIVLTRYQIAEHLSRDFDALTTSNVVDAHIKNLRKKLGRAEVIETVRGVGYRLRKPEA